MTNKPSIYSLLIVHFYFLSNINAQTNNWTGSTDNDWHKSCNWSLNTIPTVTHDVFIPTVTTYPSITGNAHCRTLNITTAAANAVTINSSGGANLCISSTNAGVCSTSPTDNGGCGLTARCLTVGGGGIEYVYYSNISIATSDGGVAMIGETRSFGGGNGDFYVIKLDNTGALAWTRVIGGAARDEGMGIIQTSDGGYAVCGETASFGAGSRDVYVVKLTSTGTVSWTRTVGGTDIDNARSIKQTADGGYILAGSTYSYGELDGFGFPSCDLYVVKLDAAGSLSWTTVVGDAGIDQAFDIFQTSDGGYIASGYSQSFGNADQLYLVRLNNVGSVLWERQVGGGGTEWGFTVIQTTDGGYAVAGLSSSYGAGGQDVYVMKLDATGATTWTRTLGGAGNDGGFGLIQTSDGGYAVAGFQESFGSNSGYVAKLTSAGVVSWTRRVNGTTKFSSISETSDGGYLLGGISTGNDFFIVKLNSDGTACATCDDGTGGTSGTGGSASGVFTFSTSGGGSGSGGANTTGGTLNNNCVE